MGDGRENEALIMSEVARGKVESFRGLFDLHHRGVLNMAYRFTGNREDAEEITQNVFIKIYEAAGRYSPRAKFTTWLYTIARNECISFQRKNRRSIRALASSLDSGEGEQTPIPVHETPASELQRRQAHAGILRAVASLPSKQKLALELQQFKGCSYADIAEVLGCSISAVESLLFRARTNLRKLLSRSGLT